MKSLRSTLCAPIVRACLAVAALVLLALPDPAQAQRLRAQVDATMACGLSFSGQIQSGDADLFASAVAEFTRDMSRALAPLGAPRTRICLDSPGGNLNEAVRIAKIIHGAFGTAVPAGARCESSCAVIFMAGSRTPEADPRGIVADRILHPAGLLGFHRLRLDVPRGNYTESTVQSAFEVALDGLAALVALSGEIDFPETLIADMLATPSDQMMHIKTVGEAARWRINVAPTPNIRALVPLAVVNACENHYNYLTDFRASPMYSPRIGWAISLFFPPQIRSGSSPSATLDGFGQERASECSVTQDRGTGPTSPWGWVGIGETSGISTSAYELYPFQFYGRDTPIRSLAFNGQAPTEGLAQRNGKWSAVHSGRCLVYSGGRQIENDPCTATSTASLNEDLTGAQEVHRFQWPSGAVTVVELQDRNRWRINGYGTEIRYLSSLPSAMQSQLQREIDRLGDARAFVNCFVNPSTGNEFCFLGYRPNYGPAGLRPGSSLQMLH